MDSIAGYKSKPCIHLTEEDFPELHDATIGQEFTLEVSVCVKELHSHDYDTADRKGLVGGDLTIKSIKVKGGE